MCYARMCFAIIDEMSDSLNNFVLSLCHKYKQ